MEQPPAVALPKLKESLNLLTGVFLKSVYFLDPELSKCLIVGLFKNRDYGLGLAVKGRKGSVFWSIDTFDYFAPRFNEISVALWSKGKLEIKSETGEIIKLCNVFGNTYVFLFDGEHSLSLNSEEWSLFTNQLPLVYIELDKLRGVTFTEGPEGGERLEAEIELLKRWPNGSCG